MYNTDVSNFVENKGIDGLHIVLKGNNDITVKDNIFVLDKSTRITSNDVLRAEATANDGYGVWFRGDADIVFDGFAFLFQASAAVAGSYNVDVNLTVNSQHFLFNSTTNDGIAFFNLNSLTLGEDLMFLKPADAYYDTGLKAITVDGQNTYKGDVIIGEAEKYDLKIAGRQVNSKNCDDILGDGVFCYDSASKTLTVSGDCTYGGEIIESEVDGLTIKVASPSLFTGKYVGNNLIRFHKTTRIVGGPLTLALPEGDHSSIGIYISEGSLTFDFAQIYFESQGFKYGITGEADVDLFIYYSDITAKAEGEGCIVDWRNITLEGCNVVEPSPSQVLPNGIADGDGNIVGKGSEGTVVITLDPDGVESIATSEAASGEVYDISGRKLDQLRRGVNIVRDKDGKAVKVVRK